MPAVTLSSKFQVVIPPDVRKSFALKPGQKIEIIIHDGRITLVPIGPMAALRGIARGIDSDVPREDDRV
ncbi:MAG: AbrB/MazE/SpoVT family DNA-binding domain-containing protein [Myxococcales bacterium]|nr:AbrB/MazE/SpoVT family DNA-binding domain-containing protein [Myxococcales bacterium]